MLRPNTPHLRRRHPLQCASPSWGLALESCFKRAKEKIRTNDTVCIGHKMSKEECKMAQETSSIDGPNHMVYEQKTVRRGKDTT